MIRFRPCIKHRSCDQSQNGNGQSKPLLQYCLKGWQLTNQNHCFKLAIDCKLLCYGAEAFLNCKPERISRLDPFWNSKNVVTVVIQSFCGIMYDVDWTSTFVNLVHLQNSWSFHAHKTIRFYSTQTYYGTCTESSFLTGHTLLLPFTGFLPWPIWQAFQD